MKNKKEEKLIDDCLVELLRDLHTFGLFQGLCDGSNVMENNQTTAQVADKLRLYIKYLLFDRDCLKREKQFLTKMLDERT